MHLLKIHPLYMKMWSQVKNNWINLLLGFPLVIVGYFMLSPISHNVSLTLVWSMTGLVFGFFISYSDSEEELTTIYNLIGNQITIFSHINSVQQSVHLTSAQKFKFSIDMNAINFEKNRLHEKILKTTQKKEIMIALLITYIITAIFVTIFPLITNF